MTEIVVDLLAAGVPINGLGDDPEITIIRLSDLVTVVSGSAMTDVGSLGKYRFQFTGDRGERYTASIDADPIATGQVDLRFFAVSFDREIFDLYRTRGLDPNQPKTTTEITEDLDYDEDIGDIHLDQVKVGDTITTSST